MPIVKMPNGETIKFPDDMPEKEIANAVMLYSKKFQPVETQYSMPEAMTQGGVEQAPVAKSNVWSEMPATIGSLIGGFFANTMRQRVPAAGILAGGGEAYHQIYQHLKGDPNAPQTSEEAATRIAKLAGLEAAGQLGGEMLVRGAGKLIPHVQERFMVPDMTGSEPVLRNFMEPYLQKGLTERAYDALAPYTQKLGFEAIEKPGYSIAQKASERSGAHRMEQIVEHSFFGAAPIQEFKGAQQKAISNWSSALVNKFTKQANLTPPGERGKMFIEAFDVAEQTFKDAAKAKYQAVDAAIEGAEVTQTVRKTSSILDASGTPFTYDVTETSNKIVDLTPFKKWVEAETKENAKFAGIASAQRGDTLISKASNLPDRMSFADSAELRSRIIQELRNAEGKPVAYADIAKVTRHIDTAMEKSAIQLGGDAEKVWREANSFYKQGKKQFDDEFLSGLISKGKEQHNLESIGSGLFMRGGVEQIRVAKKLLANDPQTLQAMKAGWLSDVLTVATKPDGLKGNALYNVLKRVGDEKLGEIMKPGELMMLKQLSEAAIKTQKLGSGGGGSILIQLIQATPLVKVTQTLATLGLAGGGAYFDSPEALAGAVMVLATPRILGNMLVNPKYHNLFYKGLSTQKPRAIPAIIKLAAQAVKIKSQQEEQTIKE